MKPLGYGSTKRKRDDVVFFSNREKETNEWSPYEAEKCTGTLLSSTYKRAHMKNDRIGEGEKIENGEEVYDVNNTGLR